MDQFEILLNHGLDIKLMIKLCFKESESIILKLNRGEPLVNAICSNQKDTYFKNIEVLSSELSLKESISCAKELKENSLGFVNDFLKESMYSIFIILFSFFMILFFSNSIMPTMMVYSQTGQLATILLLLKYLYFFLFVLILLLIIFFILIFKIKTIYVWFLHTSYSNLLKIYTSLQFSGLYRSLINKGFSTTLAIQTISKINSSYSLKCIADDLLDSLKKGDSWNQALVSSPYLDDVFVKFIKLGEMSSNTGRMLTLYEMNRKLYMKKFKKRCVETIQIVSYVSVGILVILVYQIMLAPLGMLSSF